MASRPIGRYRLTASIWTVPGWDEMLAGSTVFTFSPYGMPDNFAGIDAGGRPGIVFTQSGANAGSNLFQQLSEQVTKWTAEHRRVIIAAWSNGSRERIGALLREHGLKPRRSIVGPVIRASAAARSAS